MFKIMPLFCALSALLGITCVWEQDNKGLDKVSVIEAQRLWEMAIEAKGGRDNLYKVNSLAVSYEINQGYESTELYVFPSKHWSWIDVRPSILGVMLTVINYDRPVSYTIFGHNPVDTHEDHSPGYSQDYFIKDPQLLYFLETKWYKPELVKGYESQALSETTDAIEIKIPRFTAIVHLSKKTHLPILISYLSTIKKEPFTNLELSGYKQVAGILLPHTVKDNNARKIQRKIEINPRYDPAVFERPPSFDKGANQWRMDGAKTSSK